MIFIIREIEGPETEGFPELAPEWTTGVLSGGFSI